MIKATCIEGRKLISQIRKRTRAGIPGVPADWGIGGAGGTNGYKKSMGRMRKELEKNKEEKPVSQKMFRGI